MGHQKAMKPATARTVNRLRNVDRFAEAIGAENIPSLICVQAEPAHPRYPVRVSRHEAREKGAAL